MFLKLIANLTLGVVLTFAALSIFAQTLSGELRLVLANEMIATETLPSNLTRAETKAAVLLVHGWAGQMDEVGDIYKQLAAQLAKQGIASLRINIRGESEREASNFLMTSTFESRVTDAQTGLDYLQTNYANAKFGVVGFSLGGATALKLIGDNPLALNSLVLWSTVGDPGTMFKDLTAEQKQQVMQDDRVTLQRWVDVTITKEHYLGYKGYNIFTPLTAYRGAILSIRGSEDYLVPAEREIFAAASATPEFSWTIEGADHILNVYDQPNPGYGEQVVQATVKFMVSHLLSNKSQR
ncbi:MAG: alpha/beta fold hydrolase [Pseudomonadales bacterium]|nr:alpha/beta fold hydrolase [Pseudomonadales bacterium]MDG1443042.1 alpha/beta fold hydrolase [Pseudomonadales bacterium]